MKLPQGKLYVVTAPASVRGIYDSWAACKAVVDSVRGTQYQSVPNRDAAEAILRGESVVLPLGVYAFIDGNHLGGVGVVFVMQRDGRPPVVKEVATSVTEVFGPSRIAGLESRDDVLAVLQQIKNILAELAGLYYVVESIAAGTTFTLVHDYNGIAEWMTGRWRMKDPVVREIIAACRLREMERGLKITFRHQPGHQAVSFNEWARYNGRADALATEGGRP